MVYRMIVNMKCQYCKAGNLLLITSNYLFFPPSPLLFRAGRQLVFFKMASNHILPDPDKITYVKVTD